MSFDLEKFNCSLAEFDKSMGVIIDSIEKLQLKMNQVIHCFHALELRCIKLEREVFFTGSSDASTSTDPHEETRDK